MSTSKLEQQIAEMSDLEELDRIGYRYANGGNAPIALRAWMRAEELGCTKYRKNITSKLFSADVQGTLRKKAVAMVKQWLKEDDENAKETINLIMSIYGLEKQ